jgi:hypothetical protein
VGFVNKATTPSYRVFLSDADGTLTNLSNQQIEGTAVAKLKGAFMGSGTATADATFKAEKSGPSFDIGVRVEEVDVTKLNDIFRAYGRFDVSAGRFYFYSELDAKDGAVTGYVKPLFKDLKVYDTQQDKSKLGSEDVRAPGERRGEGLRIGLARGRQCCRGAGRMTNFSRHRGRPIRLVQTPSRPSCRGSTPKSWAPAAARAAERNDRAVGSTE